MNHYQTRLNIGWNNKLLFQNQVIQISGVSCDSTSRKQYIIYWNTYLAIRLWGFPTTTSEHLLGLIRDPREKCLISVYWDSSDCYQRRSLTSPIHKMTVHQWTQEGNKKPLNILYFISKYGQLHKVKAQTIYWQGSWKQHIWSSNVCAPAKQQRPSMYRV